MAQGAEGPRRRVGGAPLWLWWTVVAVLVAAVAVLAWLLVRGDDSTGAGATPGTTSGVTPSTQPSSGATSGTTPPATPSAPATPAPPLTMPGEHLPADGVSAIPTTEALPDDDYVVHLTGIDAAARTIDVDVEVMYIGAAADAYATAHDPAAEVPVPNGFLLVNESTRTRALPLADDVRIWDWCTSSTGDNPLGFVERSLADWAAAPASGVTDCAAGPALSHGGNEIYWAQVRGGKVEHLIGQYLP